MTLKEFLNTYVDWDKTKFRLRISYNTGLIITTPKADTYEALCNVRTFSRLSKMSVVNVGITENGYLKISIVEE